MPNITVNVMLDYFQKDFNNSET